MTNNNKKTNTVSRPAVLAVMGHIDHGKSTLLDYIRKTNVTETEAGGITQRISAYEVIHKDEKGKDKKITFIDTPGHEAFSKMRERGAKIADIAILLVSAEDGVKPQTIEAWKTIVESKTPVIVAINKIDKPGANIEKTKMALAEHEIFLEGYGGSIPFALTSAKTGEGIEELLSLILVLAEMENFEADLSLPASGFVLEANMDPKRGIEATLIIKNGTLNKGETISVEDSTCPTRIIEDFKGKPITEATPCAPVRLVGFDKMPQIGAEFMTFAKKQDALSHAEKTALAKKTNSTKTNNGEEDKKIIPVVLKADVWGVVEAIEKELEKIKSDSAEFRVVQKGVGAVSESDLKAILGSETALVLGFNVKADKSATEIALKRNIEIHFFDIIYKMTEWLAEEMERLRPKTETTETTGAAKVLKTFSRTKERQVLGGRVLKGSICQGRTVKILRRDFEIGRGKIVGLEKNKNKSTEVEEGSEFGAMIETKIEIAPGDTIECFNIVQK